MFAVCSHTMYLDGVHIGERHGLERPQSTQVLSTPYGNYGNDSDVPRLHEGFFRIAFPIETGVRCSFWWATAAPDVIGRDD